MSKKKNEGEVTVDGDTMTMEFEHYQLEIDENRGVIYIHNREMGTTIVRIAGLKRTLTALDDKSKVANSVDMLLVKDGVVHS